MKCDGIRPQCTVCIERGSACEYNDDDKRKTNMEQMEEMKARISKLESMIETLIRGATDIQQTGAHLSPPPADTSRDIRPLPNRSSTLISPTTAFGREPLAQEISPRHQTTPSRFGDVDYERLQASLFAACSDNSVLKRQLERSCSTVRPRYGRTKLPALIPSARLFVSSRQEIGWIGRVIYRRR